LGIALVFLLLALGTTGKQDTVRTVGRNRMGVVVFLTACARTAGLLACSGRLPDCVVRGDVPSSVDAGQEACGPRVHDSPDRELYG